MPTPTRTEPLIENGQRVLVQPLFYPDLIDLTERIRHNIWDISRYSFDIDTISYNVINTDIKEIVLKVALMTFINKKEIIKIMVSAIEQFSNIFQYFYLKRVKWKAEVNS